MHGITLRALRDAIRLLSRRPVAHSDGDRLVLLGMRPVTVRKAAPTSPPPTRDAAREATHATATRRVDGVEWSETQPWCHQ